MKDNQVPFHQWRLMDACDKVLLGVNERVKMVYQSYHIGRTTQVSKTVIRSHERPWSYGLLHSPAPRSKALYLRSFKSLDALRTFPIVLVDQFLTMYIFPV